MSIGALVKAYDMREQNLTNEEFVMYVDEVLPDMGVSTIVYAPQSTIEFTHPRVAGIQNLVGTQLLALPARRDQLVDSLRAFPSIRSTARGPLKLLNGGVGVLIEVPIFLPSAPEYLTDPIYAEKG